MSLTNKTVTTPVETALVERAEASGAVADAGRKDAIEALRAYGLPNRRVEAWHYTDLRALMGRVPAAAGAEAPATSFLTPFLPHSLVVELGAEPAGNDAHPGLAIARGDGAADWRETANHLDREVDTIRVVNAALGATGTAIKVAAGADVDTPIELRPEPRAEGAHGYATLNIGTRAKAVVVERAAPGAAGAVSSTVSSVELEEGAEILWIVVQEKGTDETHLGQLNVRLGADSKLRLFVLNAGGAVVRQEIHAETVGEGADIQIRGVNLLQSGQHVDVTSTLYHNVAHTTSTEVFRNVVTGGHSVFQGMIRVAKGAQKTDAKLACNSLLLSDEGDFSAKPELEIFADDVVCGHGATAGEINADHLFYLMSRGIPEHMARALLVKAFVDEVVEEIEHEAAVEALEARIDAWLAVERPAQQQTAA
ncbi:Fe-S cluster assembly protein SufD [Aureimonas mangrovi]|uniref:Fe-S cluster assembly protein SufD n=1 Tax=Aureimonas mangrovi TaxID=2758041 RepID=UPI00163D3EF3|nr:Fe-S cluster assembly protein SufD [Aureimonas mangrovi]